MTPSINPPLMPPFPHAGISYPNAAIHIRDRAGPLVHVVVFLFFIWIWLLIVVFSDIFRSQDLSGWAKALWTIFVIFLPYLGVFVYLIARGGKMQGRAVRHTQDQYRRSASTSRARV